MWLQLSYHRGKYWLMHSRSFIRHVVTGAFKKFNVSRSPNRIPGRKSTSNNSKWLLTGDNRHIRGRMLCTIGTEHSLNKDRNRLEKFTYGPGGIFLRLDVDKAFIRLPNIWLRDNCSCEKCVNPQTMQKAFDIFSLPQEIIPYKVTIETDGLKVVWSEFDGTHISLYPWSWIKKKALRDHDLQSLESDMDSHTLWDSSIKSEEPSVHYDEVMSGDEGVGKWTAKIRKFGFCYVDECPISSEKTKMLIEQIAFIRETHYGGFYDFTSDLKMKDTAYTNIALAPHTDTTYFTDPAGLQMFHLLSHAQGEGGTSILVDGFKAAHLLRIKSPAEYSELAKICVNAYSVGNKGIAIKPARSFPILNLASSTGGKEPQLYQVRWNKDDRGTIPLVYDDLQSIDRWYMAARSFNSILNMDSMQYKTQLRPGRPLIFDNWRILHGRTAFTGKRRMCGAYVNHDDYISRWRNTNFSRPQVLSAVI